MTYLSGNSAITSEDISTKGTGNGKIFGIILLVFLGILIVKANVTKKP